MAKKKINKLYLIGGAGGTVAAVLIAVFVFGVGLDFVNPLFQEPKDLTVQEVQQNEQVIIDIENVLCGGGIDSGDLDPNLPADIISDPCIPSGETTSPGEEVSPKDIEEEIKKDNEMVIDPNPVNQTMTNQTKTIFSEDNTIGQICDELDLGCGSDTMLLTSKISKIDSTGEIEIVEGRFSFSQLALFVEDVSDKDYATGRLIIELKITGEPNTAISGTGTARIGILGGANLDLFKNLNELNLQVAETTDENGEAVVFFVGPTGATSPTFTFEFTDNFNEFANESITPLKLILDRLDVNDGTNDFAMENIEFFSMDIFRDDIKIIITNEEGITERVFPSDSRLVLTTVKNVIKGTSCLIYSAPSQQTPTGCISKGVNCPCFGTMPLTNKLFNVVAGTAPAPSVIGIILFDESGGLLFSKPGGTGKIFDELLTRNENYKLTTSSPEFTSNILSYGKPQETKSFMCESDGIAKQKLVTVVTGEVNNCGRGFCNYYVYIQTDGITIGDTQCNFPQ